MRSHKFIISVISIFVMIFMFSYLKLDFFTFLHLAITAYTIFLISYKCRSFIKNFDKFSESHAPEVLTTIGIAGCFVGLIVGFAPIAIMSITEKENADLFSKIPTIITSVTLSFLSSAAGVIAALLIKSKHKKIFDKGINTEEKNKFDLLISEIKLLNKNLINREENLIQEELKMLRTQNFEIFKESSLNFDNKMNEIIKSLSNFSEHFIKTSSNTMLEALNKIVKDFNNNMIGQFGENFKELNHAVKDLVTWQQQYKDDLALMRISQAQITEDLQNNAISLSKISDHTKSLSIISKDFGEIIEKLNNCFNNTIDAQKKLVEVLIPMNNIVPEFSDKTEKFITQLDINVTKIFSNIESHEETLILNLQKSHTEMKQILTESLKLNHQELASHIKQISDDMANKVTILDTALETELNRSLESLGRALSSLSDKFVSDYAKITDNFKDILHVVATIKPELIDKVN